MNTYRLKTIALAVAVLVGLSSTSALVFAQSDKESEELAPPEPLGPPKVPVSAIIKVGERTTKLAQRSQRKIDKLSAQTGELLADFKTITKQVDGLRVYNARLERQIEGQLRRIGTIDKGIAEAAVIQRQMTPLILRMLDGLESFVSLDVPFHLEERKERVQFLRNNLDRSDLSISEKFRQVFEAYKIENEYGRKIDTYKGTAEIAGVERDVNFFRVGRISLMYQTTDTEVSGAWDQTARKWVELDKGDYRSAILKGLRIARKQASIDILKLPVPAPEAVKL